MAKSEANNFKDFIRAFPRLRYQLKDLLAQHYSWDIFADQAAKSEYVAPDLLAFLEVWKSVSPKVRESESQ